MRLRRFVDRDASAALRKVKRALGAEAVILATRPVPDGVEITAATDADLVTATAMPDAAPPEGDFGLVLRELRELGARVDRVLRPWVPLEGTLGPEARALAERLAADVAPGLAGALAATFEAERRAGTPEAAAVAASLAQHLAPAPAAAARVTAFVGPTGSGKTTTIAKLAATRAAAAGQRPALVMADTYRIGAAEQLGAYARLLGVPMVTVRDAAELARALDTLAERDAVYVDTAGLGGDAAGGAELGRLLAGAGPGLGVTAVVSAATAETALRRAWLQLERLAPTRCVVTKVDESGGAAAVCSWVVERGMALEWLGTGQRVPEDLAAPSGSALARWLLAT